MVLYGRHFGSPLDLGNAQLGLLSKAVPIIALRMGFSEFLMLWGVRGTRIFGSLKVAPLQHDPKVFDFLLKHIGRTFCFPGFNLCWTETFPCVFNDLGLTC